MNAFVVRGFYVIFILIVRKLQYNRCLVMFYENKLLLLLSTSVLNITAPNTVNTDNIPRYLFNKYF